MRTVTLTEPVRTRRRSPPPQGTKVRLLVLATLLLGGLALLAAGHLFNARRQLLLASGDLRASRQAMVKRDDAATRSILDRAGRRLDAASSAASALPLGLIKALPLLGSPVRASTGAVRAGREGVAAGRILLAASSSFPTSASAALDGHDLSAFHDAAQRSATAVAGADQRLEKAAAALAGPSGAFLPPVSAPARAMRAELGQSRQELAGVGRGLALLEGLTSSTADSRLLLLAQDSLELRPTGGFIGSYGVLRFLRGTVTLEKYEATEDLPAPVPPVPPPAGLARYLPRHFGLSNVNWWPDFPTTAVAAADMFRRQGGGEVDGVLALTEHASARLIGSVGPLKLPSYATPVVEEGFDRRVVFEVEQKRPLDQPRKKFLVELSDTLFGQLFRLPAEKLPAVADAVRRSLGTGDIQLWFADAHRQGLLAGAVVEGKLPRTDDDFLMLVDANMVASKANLDVTKQAEYRVERNDDGRLVARLRVEVRNGGGKSAINPLYNGYLRVYAPAGSRLVERTGLQGEGPADDGPFQVFSQVLVVQPDSQGVATFEYFLPERIAADRPYRLTWLRQVGTPEDRLRVVVDGRSAESGPAVRRLRFERNLS